MTLKNRTKDLGPRVNKEKAAEAENVQYSTNPRIPWDLGLTLHCSGGGVHGGDRSLAML